MKKLNIPTISIIVKLYYISGIYVRLLVIFEKYHNINKFKKCHIVKSNFSKVVDI